jgi:glutamate-1-semialdehyde 2,1-aminomutase
MIGAIIQARCESIRFPNKILTNIDNLTSIEILLKRLSKSKLINLIVVATSNHPSNKRLIDILNKNKIKFFVGDQNNVLKRYYDTAKKYNLDTIIRLTGDNPLIDPNLVDSYIQNFFKKKYDYISDSEPPTYPDGMDVEIFNFKALKQAFNSKSTKYEREHVTPLIKYSLKLKKGTFPLKEDYSFLRLTLDEKKDLVCIKKIFNYFKHNIYFKLDDIIKLYKKKPHIFKINNNITRDEGSKLSDGQKLWKRAKQIIPNGNMFYSKNPDLILPNYWPTYYKKAKGCFVWGLENKKYTDFSMMGVGTNLLGYARKEIDDAVKKNITKSNMSTLNCPEEVYLAEKLVNLHPWADQAMFARTGAEANAMAIRIARTHSKKQNIAVCGYHGWHDWYLAANLNNNKSLNNHLLPGLGSDGVLKKLKNSVYTFDFNDFNKLEKLIKNKDIGTVIMEVSRNYMPKNNFLKKVRDITKKNKIVLIFDECSSGFRETYGGLHLKYKVNPDICMFGKAIGNGYAITSIIGRGEVMKKSLDSFISSTFWSERIGYTAGCKTLEVMKKVKSWEYVTKLGRKIKIEWDRLSKKYELPISINGIDALPSFVINSSKFLHYKTFISQEMLKKNFLCTNVVFVSTAHNELILKKYIKNLDKIFYTIKECEEGKDINKLLNGPVCKSSFKRLN